MEDASLARKLGRIFFEKYEIPPGGLSNHEIEVAVNEAKEAVKEGVQASRAAPALKFIVHKVTKLRGLWVSHLILHQFSLFDSLLVSNIRCLFFCGHSTQYARVEIAGRKRSIGRFDSKEQGLLACEIAKEIFKLRNLSNMTEDQIEASLQEVKIAASDGVQKSQGAALNIKGPSASKSLVAVDADAPRRELLGANVAMMPKRTNEDESLQQSLCPQTNHGAKDLHSQGAIYTRKRKSRRDERSPQRVGNQKSPPKGSRHWTEQQLTKFMSLLEIHGEGHWEAIACSIPGHDAKSCENLFYSRYAGPSAGCKASAQRISTSSSRNAIPNPSTQGNPDTTKENTQLPTDDPEYKSKMRKYLISLAVRDNLDPDDEVALRRAAEILRMPRSNVASMLFDEISYNNRDSSIEIVAGEFVKQVKEGLARKG